MKKSILSILLIVSFLSAFFLPVLSLPIKTSAAVSQSVTDYLAGAPSGDWVVMARSAIGDGQGDTSFLREVDGQSANDYSSYILAITALRQDPRFFGEQNLVALLRRQVKDGQIGDPTLISDDIFGLLALRSAGLSADDGLLTQTSAYLKSQQLPDGSWGYGANSGQGGIDMTAMAVMALLSGGVAKTDVAITKGVNYLANAQGGDGGFPDLPGNSSNTESTAWALSALNKLGEDLNFWRKNGIGPTEYLAARQQPAGYFIHDAASSSGPNSFAPITTAYAAIALSGKFYPINSIAAPPEVNLRIEGQTDTICQTKAEAKTAMDAVKSAALDCGYAYTIVNTQYGPYLKAINSEEAAGLLGWSFLVNNQSLSVGAADYLVADDDEILLYYGNWDDLPLRVTHVGKVDLNSTASAKVKKYDYNNNTWQPAAGATLHRGGETFSIGPDGSVSLNWPTAGASLLWASGDNLIRSAKVLVAAGQDSGQAQNLALAVDIISSSPNDGPDSPGPDSGLVFSVSGDLDFGSLAAGQNASRNITIANSGAVNIAATASVADSAFFAGNLAVDQTAVSQWQKQIGAGANLTASVKLSVPAGYSSSGRQQGSLVIWANPVN